MSRELEGRRVLVSGGASGIGLAVGHLALQRGARVCLIDRDQARLEEVSKALGPAVKTFVCDVTNRGAVDAAVGRSAEGLGGIDVLVNSAGADLVSPLAQMEDADWERIMAVNLTAPMMLSRVALPFLRSSGRGSIVNVSSAAGLKPLANRTAYCTAKAGLIMFGKALAMEEAAFGIRVNAVCPGAVDTPMFRTSYEGKDDPELELERIRQRYALQRIAQPAELAEAVLYLSGDRASFITGTALAVDGGRTFH